MSISLWVGIIAIISSVISIIAVVLTRHNIVDILDKDVILFDKNFEIKKSAISQALLLTDRINKEGKDLVLKPDFKMQAENCYNDLLCVVSKIKLAEEFYAITINPNEEVTETRLAEFKLLCRQDIGLKTRGAKIVKRITEEPKEEPTPIQTNKLETSSFAMFSQAEEKPTFTSKIEVKTNVGRPKKK